MEEGKKMVRFNLATYHSEVRLERSPTAIGFSDICPCCGNKKRRCLQPASSSRKKILVCDSDIPNSFISNISPTASRSLTPPPPAIRQFLAGDPIHPMSQPVPPATPVPPAMSVPLATPIPPATLPASAALEGEALKGGAAAFCTTEKKGKKVRVTKEEGAAGIGETRVHVRCPCGLVRKIHLAP